MAVPPIFKDEAKQALFEKQGFLTLPFLNAEDLAALRTMFKELHSSVPDGGFVSGSASSDFNYKKKASNQLVQLFRSSFDKHFENYQSFGASFLFKLPNESSEVGIHQDWTIVDEEKYVALNIWVPLDDINEHNGPLMVLPGSHYSKHAVHRSPTLPFFFQFREEELIKKLIPQYVKAGEAVVLNQSLIHYSPINTSGKLRRAVTAGIKTKDAPMRFYYKPDPENSDTKVFKMDEDFLIKFDNFVEEIFQEPKHGSVEEIVEYDVPKYEDEALDKLTNNLMISAGFKRKSKNIFQKLFQSFAKN